MFNLKQWIASVTASIVELYNNGKYKSVSYTTANAKTIPTGTNWTNLCSIKLPPGRYLIYGRVRYSANSSGYRELSITTTSKSYSATMIMSQPATPTTYTYMSIMAPLNVTSTKTIYLTTRHNAGTSLTAGQAGISATRVRHAGASLS